MDNIKTKLAAIDWQPITAALNEKGFALVPGLLPDQQCKSLIKNYNDPGAYRKTVVMERHRFGLGEYKYFNYPLPGMIKEIRDHTYAKLAPVANLWMKALNMDKVFPDTHSELLELCHNKNQRQATVLILKYGKGGYNTLHQDLYGELFFPFQAVLFLSDPDREYAGGEFVLVQQNPRAQSKAMVLTPKLGDMLIFTTNFRPVKSTRGYYRANMKHGVSEVHTGERYTLGIIFHDALN